MKAIDDYEADGLVASEELVQTPDRQIEFYGIHARYDEQVR